MKTRTKQTSKAASKANDNAQAAVSQTKALPEAVKAPPNLFVLPKDISKDARIIPFPCLGDSKKQSRLLVCPKKGYFEFTQVSNTESPRSWLLTPQAQQDETAKADGYVLKQPDLLIATPVHPRYIGLQFLTTVDDFMQSYLTLDDFIFQNEFEGIQPLRGLFQRKAFRGLLDQLGFEIEFICTSMDFGGEQVYRISQYSLCERMVMRARDLAKAGLPASMETKFVVEASQIPETFVEESEMIEQGTTVDGDSNTQPSTAPTSQATASSDETTDSVSTSATSLPDEQSTKDQENIKYLLRVRTVFEYMLRSYVPKVLHADMRELFAANRCLVDIAPLLEHEKKIEAAKQKVQALRTLSDNISRKRPAEDDEAAAKAEAKRQKKEEEDQRKKNVSHGVKKLAKADTSGMKKLSSFFAKAPPKKK